jgi:CRP-like cAMP-binding protein
MSVRADAETLRAIPIFRDCDSVPLQVMAFAAERQNFMLNETIITQGKISKSAYFIMSGSAAVMNKKEELGIAHPGALLGELAMISGAPSTLTAIAKETTTMARIDQALFLRVADEYPDFGRAVLQAISRRLETTVREFDSVRVMMNKARSFSDL